MSARRVLAIDTASAAGGIALASSAQDVEERYLGDTKAKGERLAELTRELLAARSLEPSAVDGIGVCVGPGSYTGLRVGLSFARGLALVDDLPAVGVGSLELVALAGRESGAAGKILAVLHAGRDRVYAAAFDADREELKEIEAADVVAFEDFPALVERLAPDVVCHEPGVALPAVAAASLEVQARRAGLLAAETMRRLERSGGTTAEAVLPRYVGAANARKNSNRVVLGTPGRD